ncbi:cyclic pyranopterin monophosphate synthase MoaC, partial [Candidatus Margulisiibacteriota bacterium]
VNVGGKPDVKRIAIASGRIFLAKKTLQLIKKNKMQKGDVLTLAKIAGIQAAKRTSELIPLCHPLALTHVSIDCELFHNLVKVTSKVELTGKTGVEMEALTAVSVALLSIYDMCKAVDKKMRIGDIKLCQKSKQSV